MKVADRFARSGFAGFMNSPSGRLARLVVGAALIAWGWMQHGTGGVVLMVVGLIPLAAGAFNLCLISAVLGGPISGVAVVKRRSQG